MRRNRWWKADPQTRATCARLVRFARKNLRDDTSTTTPRAWFRGLLFGALLCGSNAMNKVKIPKWLQT